MSASMFELTDVARTLLHTLLDRAEQPGRQRVVRLRLSPENHPEYFSGEDVAPRRATHDAMRRLAAAGVVSLRWRKWEEDNWLEAVDLMPSGAAALYALLGRQPRTAQVTVLRELLVEQTPRPGWHGDFLARVQAQLEAGRSPAPLVLDDAALNGDLLRALAAIADLQTPVLERTLSTRLFGNSKRLEELRQTVLWVLRRHDPRAEAFGNDDWALLRAHNLDRVPEHVPLAGPLVLQYPGEGERSPLFLDITPFHPSVALSAAMLREVEIAACGAQAIVTVENATSFSELLAVRPPEMLALYSGGFASPTVIRLLQAIRRYRPDLPLFHWGDIDVGGLRILAHLRAQLGAVSCVAMSVETLNAYRANTRLLSTSERDALVALKAYPVLADCAVMISTMLELGVKLEQEAVEADAALTQLPPI